MIKLDEITEIEIKDGILTISQFDNNEVILTQDNLKKLYKAINDTRCCTGLCDKCNKENHLQKLTDQAQDLGLGYD